MIPPELLNHVMWTVIVLWIISASFVLVEVWSRARRAGRLACVPGAWSVTDDAAMLAVADGSTGRNVESRIQALRALTLDGHPERHATLAIALRAPEPEVAAMAVRLLRELDDERAVRVLVEALAAGVYVPSRIAAALDRMNTERGSLLGPLLEHGDETVRFWSLLLVGRSGDARWMPTVRTLLSDSSAMVRRAAVEVCGRLGVPDDRDLVLARLADPEPMVRVHAARAAVRFGNARVADALVAVLADREWSVRAAARDSLCRLGGRATPAVTRALWGSDAFAANCAAEVLFLTGATLHYVERLLEWPDSPERLRLVDRVIAASGPQIVRAVHDQLTPQQEVTLRRLVGDGREAPVRVKPQ